VIVAAARTGTNLLIGLLNDFEGCFVGSELFNDNNVSNDIIPWHDISDGLRGRPIGETAKSLAHACTPISWRMVLSPADA
jgi:hypothetical protein